MMNKAQQMGINPQMALNMLDMHGIPDENP